VRNSFELLREHGPLFMERFYERLFTHYPYVRSMFQHDMGKQRLAFLGVLGFLVENCDRPSAIRASLAELGRVHGRRGVVAGHYPAVSESLLRAMADTAGDLWTDEVNDAWARFLDLVTEAMLDT